MGKFYGQRVCKHPNCDMQFSPYRSWQEFCCQEHRNDFYEKFTRHPFNEALNKEEGKGGHKNGKPEKFR